MNLYYAACVYHSVWLFICESRKCITWPSEMNMFSHCKTDLLFHFMSLNLLFGVKSAQQIAHIGFVCLFVSYLYIFFFLLEMTIPTGL